MFLGQDLRNLETSWIEGQQEEGRSQAWELEEMRCRGGRGRRLCPQVETS